MVKVETVVFWVRIKEVYRGYHKIKMVSLTEFPTENYSCLT